MAKRILIVGGGTAGWLTAGYLAKRLAADRPGGVAVTLVESAAIGILGVGEGTFPTIRKTLATIGVDEAEMVRRCGATFKQGARFAHWRHTPGAGRHDDRTPRRAGAPCQGDHAQSDQQMTTVHGRSLATAPRRGEAPHPPA